MAKRFLNNIRINDAYTFPASDGTDGQVIKTDGSGNLTFSGIAADSASVMYKDTFTGDGSTTVFNMANALSDEVQSNIYIDGVYQSKSTYSVANKAITFSTAPLSGHAIEVISTTGINSGPTAIYTDTFTGNGSTTAFTLAQTVHNENQTLVFLNGVYQFKNTYTLSGTTLTLDTAPANLVAIEVMSIGSAYSGGDILYDHDFTSAGLMTTNGSGTYSITAAPTVGDGGLTQNNFTNTLKSKLDAIEASADVTDATNVTAAGALMDSEVTNLALVKGLATGISDGNILAANDAVADDDFLRVNGTEVEGLTVAEVLTALNVESGADVTDTANVTAAGALMDSELTNLTAVKAINQGLTTSSNVAFGNITATGYLRGPASFTIDPATHGDNTGTVVIAGNLQVDGTTTTINSTTVAIDDLNFSIATDAADSAAANGAGITIGGASATLLYTHATTSWDMNKPLIVTGAGTFSGIITAQSSSSGDYVRMYGSSGTGKWDIYGNGANLRISDNESAGILAVDTAATFGGAVTTSDVYGTSSLRLAALGGTAYLDSGSGSSVIIRTNGTTTALTLNSSQNATFAGDIISSGSSKSIKTFRRWQMDGNADFGINNASGSSVLLISGGGTPSTSTATFAGTVDAVTIGSNTASLRGTSLTIDSRLTLHDGEIDCGSGDLTLDSAGRILLDSSTDGDVRFLDDGTQYGQIFVVASNMYLRPNAVDADLYIQGNDNGSYINMLYFNTSHSGNATFSGEITAGDDINAPTKIVIGEGAAPELRLKKTDAGYAKVSFYNNPGSSAQAAYISLDAAEDFTYYGASGVDQVFYAGGALNLTLSGTNATFAGNVHGVRFILPSTASAANQWIYTNNTNTGTGSLTIQSGGGSAAYGGGLILYSHSHASKPGWVKAGISSGSGGKFSVNSQGIGGGTDVFTVDATGAGQFNGVLRVPQQWDSSSLAGNSIYAATANDGFAFGVGTGISTWWSYSNTSGVRRMIDVDNDGTFVRIRTSQVDRMIIDSSSGATTLTLGQAGEVPEIKAGGANTDLRLSAVGAGGWLDLQTNATSRMRILGGGNVGINDTSPGTKLSINGANYVEMATFAAAAGSTSGIVTNNVGYVTSFTTSATHVNSNTALFVPVTDGIKITKAGLLHVTVTQDFISTLSSGYCSVQIRKNGTIMFYSLRTNSNNQWDMINSTGTMLVAANDEIGFYYSATDFTHMDTGSWSQYSFIWTSR